MNERKSWGGRHRESKKERERCGDKPNDYTLRNFLHKSREISKKFPAYSKDYKFRNFTLGYWTAEFSVEWVGYERVAKTHGMPYFFSVLQCVAEAVAGAFAGAVAGDVSLRCSGEDPWDALSLQATFRKRALYLVAKLKRVLRLQGGEDAKDGLMKMQKLQVSFCKRAM